MSYHTIYNQFDYYGYIVNGGSVSFICTYYGTESQNITKIQLSRETDKQTELIYYWNKQNGSGGIERILRESSTVNAIKDGINITIRNYDVNHDTATKYWCNVTANNERSRSDHEYVRVLSKLYIQLYIL
jgi:hypothetical protein